MGAGDETRKREPTRYSEAHFLFPPGATRARGSVAFRDSLRARKTRALSTRLRKRDRGLFGHCVDVDSPRRSETMTSVLQLVAFRKFAANGRDDKGAKGGMPCYAAIMDDYLF